MEGGRIADEKLLLPTVEKTTTERQLYPKKGRFDTPKQSIATGETTWAS